MAIRKTTCKRCGSKDINITWKYNKKDEMAMYMGHDGFGFQFEDATIKCAKCGSKELVNLEYNIFGRVKKEEME